MYDTVQVILMSAAVWRSLSLRKKRCPDATSHTYGQFEARKRYLHWQKDVLLDRDAWQTRLLKTTIVLPGQTQSQRNYLHIEVINKRDFLFGIAASLLIWVLLELDRGGRISGQANDLHQIRIKEIGP